MIMAIGSSQLTVLTMSEGLTASTIAETSAAFSFTAFPATPALLREIVSGRATPFSCSYDPKDPHGRGPDKPGVPHLDRTRREAPLPRDERPTPPPSRLPNDIPRPNEPDDGLWCTGGVPEAVVDRILRSLFFTAELRVE